MSLKNIISAALVLFVFISCTNYEGNKTTQIKEKDQNVGNSNLIESNSLLAKSRYSDPNNFFKIVPPADWKIERYPQEPRGKVAFFGPDMVELRVLAKGLDYDSFEDMYNEIKDIERTINTNTNMTKFMFFGIPAVKRQFAYKGLKILFIDFMLGNTTHNIMYSGSPQKFPLYESIAWESINTYEPVLREVTAAEVKKHVVARSIRLSKIFFENGEYELSKIYIDEGLKEDPENIELLEMQKIVTKK